MSHNVRVAMGVALYVGLLLALGAFPALLVWMALGTVTP